MELGMEITQKDVKKITIEYKDWHDDSMCYASLTEWENGEGYDLDLESKGSEGHLKLSVSDVAAILILFGKKDLIE